MLNLKNNKNHAAIDEICKKKRRLKYNFKNVGNFFGQHPLVEKSQPLLIYLYVCMHLIKNNEMNKKINKNLINFNICM